MNKRGAVMAKEHNFFKMEMLILLKLADDHCITGMEVREGRRTKIIYKLEPKGEALLVTLQKRYTVWVQAIDMIMKGA